MHRALAPILIIALAAPALADGKPERAKQVKNSPGHAMHCPPGLAKKDPPCLPPGQAKKSSGHDDDWDGVWRVGDRIHDDYIWVHDPWRYGLRDRGTYWRIGDNFFRVDRETGKILAVLGALEALVD